MQVKKLVTMISDCSVQVTESQFITEVDKSLTSRKNWPFWLFKNYKKVHRFKNWPIRIIDTLDGIFDRKSNIQQLLREIEQSNHRRKDRWNKLPTIQPSAATQLEASHKCMNGPRLTEYLSIKTLKRSKLATRL